MASSHYTHFGRCDEGFSASGGDSNANVDGPDLFTSLGLNVAPSSNIQ